MGIADLIKEGYRRLTDPEDYDPTEGVHGTESSEFMAVTRPGAAPRQPKRAPSRLPQPKFDATGLPVYDPEQTADVAREQEAAAAETKAPEGAVNYRDPKAVAEYTAHWLAIASGATRKPDGTEYTHQEREQARALANNLNLRMGLEEAKGGFGRRYASRMGSYVPPGLSMFAEGTNADIFRKEREAAETGDLPTQEDIQKFGKPWRGTELRAEPTFIETMKEEAPAAIAGDITAMILAGEGRFIAAGGEVAGEIGMRGVSRALRIAAEGGAPTAETALGRAGQRVITGGVPGMAVGATGDYAETRARGGTPAEAMTAAGANAALGFGMGAGTQIIAGAAWDAVGPSVKRLASRLASALPKPFENHNAAIYEAILREKEAAEATQIVNQERVAAGKLPIQDKNPEAHFRQIADALEQILAQKDAVAEGKKAEMRGRWAGGLPEGIERRAENPEDRPVWTPDERDAYHAERVAQWEQGNIDSIERPQHPDVFAANFARGRAEPFPFQREPGAPPWRLTEQADMSKNMERLQAERQAAELRAVEEARIAAEAKPPEPVVSPKAQRLSTIDTRGKNLSDMTPEERQGVRNKLMAKRDALRERADASPTMAEAKPHEIDRESIQTLLKAVERDLKRVDDSEPIPEAAAVPSVGEEAGRQAAPAVLAVGSEESDNEDTKAALAAAAALSTGREGTALHEGERYFSRLTRFLESKPWKGAIPVGDVINKLKTGPFSQEEFRTTLLPALQAHKPETKLTHAEVLSMQRAHEIQLGDVRYTQTGRAIVPGEEAAAPPAQPHRAGAERSDTQYDPTGPFPDDYESEVARVRETREEQINDAREELGRAETAQGEAMSDVEEAFSSAGGGPMRFLHQAMERSEEDGAFDVRKAMQTLHENGAFENYYAPAAPANQTSDGYRIGYSGEDNMHTIKKNGVLVPDMKFENELEALVALDKLTRDQLPTIGNLRDILDDVTIKKNEEDGDWELYDDSGNLLNSNQDRDTLIQEHVNDTYEPDENVFSELESALQTYAERVSDYYETESNTYRLREESDSEDSDFMEELEAAREADQEAMDQHLEEHGADTPVRDARDPEQMAMVLRGTSTDGVPSTTEIARQTTLPLKSQGKSKFTTYQRVPGGKNYREILIQWDNKQGRAFEEGHWSDEPNVVGHLRMTEHEYVPPSAESIKAFEDIVARRKELGKQQGEIARQYAEMTERGPFDYSNEAKALAARYAQINEDVMLVDHEYDEAKRAFEKRREGKSESTLNAFEHQSDWKQQGEEKGFYVVHAPEIVAQTKRELEELEPKRLALIAEKERIIDKVTDEWAERWDAANADATAKQEEYRNALGGDPEKDNLRWKAIEASAVQQNVTRQRSDALDVALEHVRERLGAHADLVEMKRRAIEPSGLPDMPFKQPADVFGLTSARMLHEAAEGDYDRLAWSTAANRNALAGLSLEAGKITYDQSVTGAVKKLLKGLGVEAKIERITMDGYEHFSIKLDSDTKAKIKKFGFPLLGALAATATSAESASAQDGTKDKPNPFIPIAPLLLAAGVLVVRHAALRKGAVKEFEYFVARGGEEALKKFDVRNAKTPKLLTPMEVGEAIARENLKDGVPYIRVPKNQIYDTTTDPHGIIAKLVKTGEVTPEKMTDAIQRAGFVAYKAEDGIKLIGAPGDDPIPARLARAIDSFNAKEGLRTYSNPVGPALALLKRSPTAASLAVLGVAADNSDDRNIHRMSRPLIGLAALNAIGSKALMKGGDAVVKTLVEQLARTEAGRATVRFMSPALLLPEEINAGLAVRRSELAKGRARAAEYGKMSRDLGGKGDREVSDVLEKEDWEGLNGPTVAGVMSVAQAHEAEIARLTAEQLRSGVLQPEQVIENYSGPRKYAEYEALDVWKNDESGGRSVPGGSRRIGEVKRRTLDIPIREAETALDEAMQGGDPVKIQEAMDAVDAAQVEQLGQRLERGEIRESSYRIETHIAKASLNIANADFLHLASTTPGMVHTEFKARLDDFLDARANMKAATNAQDRAIWQSLMDDRKLAMDDISRRYQTKDAKWATLPDTPGLGVLRGMVVDKALHAEIVGVPENMGIDKVMNAWKQLHTVFNPGTNVANVVSNIPILHLAGVPIWEQPLYLGKAMKDLKGYGEATRALTEGGVFNLNFANATAEGESVMGGREGALRALSKTTRPETADVLRTRSGGLVDREDTVGETARKPLDWVRQLYNNEDNVFRAALFIKRRAQGASIADATEAARSEFGNFYTRSPALSVLRRSVSPFVLWPLKVLPPVAKNVVDHPYRYLTLIAAGAALDEYSKSQVGEIPEEDIEVRDRRKWGYFFPGFTQLPFVDSEGRKAAIDISRFTPFSNATDVANQGSTGAAISDRFPRILTPSGPGAELWNIAANNYDSFRGEPRYSDTSGPWGVAGEIAKDLGRAAAPPAFGFHLPRVLNDLANSDRAKAGTDALGLLGARPRFTEPGGVAFRAQLDYEKDMQRLNRELKRALNASRNPARDEELYRDYDAKVDRAAAKYEATVSPPAR